MAGESASEGSLSGDPEHKAAKEMLHKVGGITDKHDALHQHVSQLEDELKQQMEEFAKKGVPDDLLGQLSDLNKRILFLGSENDKDKEALLNIQNAIQQLQVQCDCLTSTTEQLSSGHQQIKDRELLLNIQNAIQQLGAQCDHLTSTTEQLSNDHRQIKYLQDKVDLLGEKKADKELLELEINVVSRET
ncbi:uncharacterized protein LOC102359830 [Latimeria chalumnae]|uniref:uncharacterized protein LOC102359830 n=1 Tax=Latimeria chalumnae TaxID=7897 RepID=UPI00313E0E9F